jgi:hypothetical protein
MTSRPPIDPRQARAHIPAPFGVEELRELLRSKVLGPLPKFPTAEKIKALALGLALMKDLIRISRASVGEDAERRKIAEATATLIELLPASRDAAAASAVAAAYWRRNPPEGGIAQSALAGKTYQEFLAEAEVGSQADVAAHDALLDAANAFFDRGLPHTPVLVAMGQPVERWKGIARHLVRAFNVMLCERKDADHLSEQAYRFLVATIPRITGEEPTFSAVKTFLVQRRDRKSEVGARTPRGCS